MPPESDLDGRDALGAQPTRDAIDETCRRFFSLRPGDPDPDPMPVIDPIAWRLFDYEGSVNSAIRSLDYAANNGGMTDERAAQMRDFLMRVRSGEEAAQSEARQTLGHKLLRRTRGSLGMDV